MLRKKSGYLPTKPSGAATTVSAAERASVIAAVKAYTKSSLSESVSVVPVGDLQQADFSVNDEIFHYLPFVSDGYVSLVRNENKVPVKILRDPR